MRLTQLIIQDSSGRSNQYDLSNSQNPYEESCKEIALFNIQQCYYIDIGFKTHEKIDAQIDAVLSTACAKGIGCAIFLGNKSFKEYENFLNKPWSHKVEQSLLSHQTSSGISWENFGKFILNPSTWVTLSVVLLGLCLVLQQYLFSVFQMLAPMLVSAIGISICFTGFIFAFVPWVIFQDITQEKGYHQKQQIKEWLKQNGLTDLGLLQNSDLLPPKLSKYSWMDYEERLFVRLYQWCYKHPFQAFIIVLGIALFIWSLVSVISFFAAGTENFFFSLGPFFDAMNHVFSMGFNGLLDAIPVLKQPLTFLLEELTATLIGAALFIGAPLSVVDTIRRAWHAANSRWKEVDQASLQVEDGKPMEGAPSGDSGLTHSYEYVLSRRTHSHFSAIAIDNIKVEDSSSANRQTKSR